MLLQQTILVLVAVGLTARMERETLLATLAVVHTVTVHTVQEVAQYM
jgi:hypothetical protein